MRGPFCARLFIILVTGCFLTVGIHCLYADSIAIFNEISYHPTAEADGEWIELRNLLAIDLDVSGWSIAGGVDYRFPDGTILAADGYLVIADDPDALIQLTGLATVLGPFEGNLSNSGEELILLNNDQRVMDVLDYRDSGDWPVAPDGSGVTLARRDRVLAAGDPGNWMASYQMGGTPGRTNFPDEQSQSIRHSLIPFNDSWRYNDWGVDWGDSWRQVGFDDYLWLTGEAGFYSGQVLVGANPTPITTLFSTGVGENDQVLSPGQSDPHYFMTASQNPVIVMQNHSAWVANDAGSMWVGLSAQGTDNQPAGNYSFSTTFDLTGWLPETASISLRVAVDNELLDVKINGVSTGVSVSGHAAFSGPFTITSGFIAGINQLEFLFSNWDTYANPMGLRLELSGTARPVLGRTSVAEGPVTHYFRKAFNYNGDTTSSVNLLLDWVVDDGAICYLNGVEIYRYNLADGEAGYHTRAEVDIVNPQSNGIISIPTDLLTPGTNVVAVEVHQSQQDLDVAFAATLDAIETPMTPDTIPAIAFNEQSGLRNGAFWMELVNYGDETYNLSGMILACAGDVSGEYILTSGVLMPGEFLLLSESELGFRPADEDKLFLYTPNKFSVTDGMVVKNSPRARYPQATGAWCHPVTATPGGGNQFNFQRDIVINEIMYNHSLLPGTDAVYETRSVISPGAAVKVKVPKDNSAGQLWTGVQEPFDDSVWTDADGMVTGVGYERDSGYEAWIGADVEQKMYDVNRSVYLRIPFELTNVDAVDELRLKMLYDDAFIAYINGQEVARSVYAPASAQWDSGAGGSHEATDYEIFELSAVRDVLVEGQNILAIHGFNYGVTSTDLIFLPELEVRQMITPAMPPGESGQEWIELYNKGAVAVDLTGWELEGGVSYEFEEGESLAPDTYLIIARQPDNMVDLCPVQTQIVGPFDGRLSNKAESLILIDSVGNIADRVDYYDGKPWPGYADGYRSSLELRNPLADNAKAEAWRASDESVNSAWQTYSYRAVAQSSALGPDGQWQEFVLGLLESGEIWLDDISVVEDPDGSAIELIRNGAFESGVTAWRLLGNHGHSEVIVDPDQPGNSILRLVATGSEGHMHNHLETTLANGRAITNGRTYEISWRARWIAGSNLLNTRLYFNRVARTTAIAQPQINGTPGRVNRCFETNIGPTFCDLIHQPAVPQAGEPVVVTVAACDPDGVAEALLWWHIDGQAWNSVAMTKNSADHYSAMIPGQVSGTVVQFFVQAQDGLGMNAASPAGGAASRALYQVEDSRAATNGLHNLRIIMLADDYNWMHNSINLMSDDRLGATVIYNEKDIYYDTGVRLKSSQRHRLVAAHVGFNISFPRDRLFNGIHQTIAIDRSEGVLAGQREMLVNLVLNRVAGCQLSKYSDLIRVIAPATQHSGDAELQLARFNSEFLDAQFADGSDGPLYEYEYIYYPRYTLSGDVQDYKIPNDDGVVSNGSIRDQGSDPESYRWQYLKKNNQDLDDFGSLMDFARVFGLTGTSYLEQISDVIDVDQWLRMFAVAVVHGAGDHYGGDNAQHNMQLYQRPSDGRMLYFIHDLDAFYTATRPLIANTDLSKLMANPAWERRYYGNVYDVIQTAYNTAYLQRWTNQIGALLPTQSFASHLSFVGQRSSYLLGQLAARVASQYAFAVTNENFSVKGVEAQIGGEGWIDVDKVYLQGFEQPLQLNWSASGSGTGRKFYWNSVVPLQPGENNLVLEAYDFQGRLVGTDTVTITSQADVVPLREYLRISEIMPDPLGGKDYEFIELYNTGSESLDLSGLSFVNGIDFNFTTGTITTLPAGAYLVVVNDMSAFIQRYGTAGIVVAGEYSGSLANEGERIELADRWGAPLIIFDYETGDPWPLSAEGAGHSLVPLTSAMDSQPTGSLSYGGNWRASAYRNGSPGQQDPELPVTLVLNEIMAHTDYSDPLHSEYDSNDWIELINRAGAEIIISPGSWYLSDSPDQLDKWTIPGMTLAASAIISFDEVTGFHQPITEGFGLNKAGEAVYLSWLPVQGPGRVVDCVRFAAQENEVSLGRYPDGLGFWGAMVPTRDTANRYPYQQVYISELMYNPLVDGFEYIEITNPTHVAVALWDAITATGWRLNGGIDYSFGPDDVIPAGERLVLVDFTPDAAGLEAFRQYYQTVPVRIVGPYSGSLSNGGECVVLEKPILADNPDDPLALCWVTIDDVCYFDQSPWPVQADGGGAALERRSNPFPGCDPQSWFVNSATPGIARFDLDASGLVDMIDFSYLAQSWLSVPDDAAWNSRIHWNDAPGEIIGISDLTEFVDQWMKP